MEFIMLEIKNIAAPLGAVLQKIMRTQLLEFANNTEPLCGESYEIIGAAPFTGDYSLILVMLAPKDKSELFARLLLEQFNLSIPVARELLFSEIMNIFSGNLSTSLKNELGVNLYVGIPLHELSHFDKNEIFNLIHYSFNNNLELKFAFIGLK